MRTTLTFIIISIVSQIVYGQRTEFSLQAGSGLFSFYGPSAVNETRIGMSGSSYLTNPYGRKAGFSYSLAGQVQYITKNKFLYGLQMGYEQLTSQVAITAIVGDFGNPTPTTGQGSLQNEYLNLNPFVGKRFGNARVGLDAAVGLDVAIGLLSRESGSVQPLFPFLQITGQNHPIPDVDLRPRLSLTGYYRTFGLSAGYSYGLSNYTRGYGTNTDRVYAHFWRVGIAYRFGKQA